MASSWFGFPTCNSSASQHQSLNVIQQLRSVAVYRHMRNFGVSTVYSSRHRRDKDSLDFVSVRVVLNRECREIVPEVVSSPVRLEGMTADTVD